ncbi:MAG: succinate dehydrogenase, cytochrome b556 subunit [Rickettsiales bacterium]|nr:succinate dehydrogenase, cytochrome b556 subunit [Rickettsiales bacterium]
MSKEIKKSPTSPHLQIYRWNVCSLTSIFHRLTGIALYVSIVAISWYVVFYTYQMNIEAAEEACDCPMQEIMNFIFAAAGCALTFALYYHFCNGVRHLFWDIGKGFEKETAQTNAFLVIILSAIFTVLTIGSVVYFKLF